ncbi:MAG: protein disulfide-isomerase [Aureliella sp.]
MAIDPYSPCPCGSGKKLKFCKCVDNVQDLEKVLKLIEGGQGVAALDRINQLLQKTPNAAWLLAIKGELSLQLGEVETLCDTADRFLKLKPDNPLALVMSSVASNSKQEPIENSARLLLDGMAESRESLPALTLTAIDVLLRNLMMTGNTSLVGFWADILASLTRDSGPQDNSPLLDPSINLLCKVPPKAIDDASSVAWNERLAEVLALTRTFRFSQAESKLRSILRDFPDQPGPLSHLLRCQLAQLDQSGAFNTATKLAESLEVSDADRCYFGAIALELEPNNEGLQCPSLNRYVEIGSEDEVIEKLLAHPNAIAADGESMQQGREYYAALVGDEVPAKSVISLTSGPTVSDEASDDRTPTKLAATFIIFGKQTDRPSRLLVTSFRFHEHESLVADVCDSLPLGDALDMPKGIDMHYVAFLGRPRFVQTGGDDVLTMDETSHELTNDFLNLPINLLGGKSPMEVREDEAMRGKLRSLLAHLEGSQQFVLSKGTIAGIYEKLEIPYPAVEVDETTTQVQMQDPLALTRIDVTQPNDDVLFGVLVRAMSFGASRTFHHAAQEVLGRPGLSDRPEAKISVLSGLLSTEPSPDKRLQYAVDLEDALVASGRPVGRAVLQRIGLLNSLGRDDEAREALTAAVQKYPEDEYLVSFLQYAMQSQGGGMPGGVPGGAPQAGPTETESGIVLPGQEGGQSGGGESKLWLPGS